MVVLLVISVFALRKFLQQAPAVAGPVGRRAATIKRLVGKMGQRLDMQGSRRRPARFVKATRRFFQTLRGPVKSANEEIILKVFPLVLLHTLKQTTHT